MIIILNNYKRKSKTVNYGLTECLTQVRINKKNKIMKLQTKVTLLFKNKEGLKIELNTTLLDLLNRTTEDFYEDLESECTNSGCNNESQNFCDCGAVYEDYVIDEVVFDVKPSCEKLGGIDKKDFDEWLHKNNFLKQTKLQFVWNDIHVLDYKFVIEKYKEDKAKP